MPEKPAYVLLEPDNELAQLLIGRIKSVSAHTGQSRLILHYEDGRAIRVGTQKDGKGSVLAIDDLMFSTIPGVRFG